MLSFLACVISLVQPKPNLSVACMPYYQFLHDGQRAGGGGDDGRPVSRYHRLRRADQGGLHAVLKSRLLHLRRSRLLHGRLSRLSLCHPGRRGTFVNDLTVITTCLLCPPLTIKICRFMF